MGSLDRELRGFLGGGQHVLVEVHMEAARVWLTDYLCGTDPRVGRPGAVCPFVAPAIRADTLRLELWPVSPRISVTGMMSLVNNMVSVFEGAQWASRNRMLHTLVVVLDGLPLDKLTLTDEAHRQVKPELVARGLMLGQFHPRCDERAARNPSFRVSRSPVPMLALRQMAVHDVLFLDGDSRSFTAYDQRYGKRYDSGSVPDPLFVKHFARARARFGEGAAAACASGAGTAVAGDTTGTLVAAHAPPTGDWSSAGRRLYGLDRTVPRLAAPPSLCPTDSRGAM
ncbi:DUF6875 domain-containing protein [Streptomyces sp. NBC_01408]|uniref:DUF6875 domain-containing protein n=1 Tax=Streptomyces sp. NBC_01408 TaxID=2903855 RepID=UPI00225A2BEF|nr:hypothetical protein [Streptomyces sp. NBC_01408]MCX4695661.1 hypothetical protein [Streptomyces sp. NBC_01408]